MPAIPAPDDPDRSDEDDPPSSAGVDPIARELLRELRRSNRVLATQMREGHTMIVDALGAKNTADERRHTELVGAIGKIDTDLDDKRADGVAWRDRVSSGAREVWSVFKGPLANGSLAIGAYLTWHYLQIPPTPTPMQISQPVVVEAAQTRGAAAAAEPVTVEVGPAAAASEAP